MSYRPKMCIARVAEGRGTPDGPTRATECSPPSLAVKPTVTALPSRLTAIPSHRRPAARSCYPAHMASREYTRHQRGIINRYYENLDTITLQRLGEIVSELYLAPTDKKRDQLWDRAAQALARVTKAGDASAVEARKVLAARDIEGLARLVGGMS